MSKSNIKTEILDTPRLHIRIESGEEYVHAFHTLGDEALKVHFGFSDEQLQVEKGKVAGGLTTYRTALVYMHLIEKGNNNVVGSFAYHNWFPMHRRSEIGYAMKREEYKNKGYMKEALPLIIAFGFEAMNLNRMEAYISPGNAPSRKLVERAGFQREGLLQEHYCYDNVITDSIVYALLLRNYKPIL